MDQFGLILHHNVDKILLCGGASRASFGGGESEDESGGKLLISRLKLRFFHGS
jgi:hypothetical protein